MANGTDDAELLDSISIIVTTFQLLFCTTGFMLYILVCWIIIRYKKTTFSNSLFTLALALAFADCVHLLSEILCALPAAYVGYENVPSTFMAVCGFLADAAYWTLAPLTAVIGVNRYIAVFHVQTYKRSFSPSTLVIVISTCVALGIGLPTLMYSCTCIYLFKGYSWKFYCSGGCGTVALMVNVSLASSLTIVVVLVYTVIFVRHKIQTRKTNESLQTNGENARTRTRETSLMFQFSLISLVLVLYIATFWLTNLLVNNRYGDMICNFWINFNSCVSPILYLSFGSEFRKRLPWKSTVEPMTNVIQTKSTANRPLQGLPAVIAHKLAGRI